MAKIHKIIKDKQTIYPATTTDAVVNPKTRKSLTEELAGLLKNRAEILSVGRFDGKYDGVVYRSKDASANSGWIPYFLEKGEQYIIGRSFNASSATSTIMLKYEDGTEATVVLSTEERIIIPPKNTTDIKFIMYGYQSDEVSEMYYYIKSKDIRESIESNTAAITVNAEAIETLARELEALGACGFARVNGSADPDAQVSFGDTAKLRALASHLHLGAVKDGKLVKQCAPGRLTASVDGKEIAIDGTDGDIMNFTDCDLYYLKATMPYTPQGGTEAEYNIVALSLLPFAIGGRQAKRIRPFAIVPGECVTAKLEGDTESCAHFVYNKNAIGTYNAPMNIFKQSYKTSGGGYPTQYVSSIQSVKNAQAKNADGSNRPYMGMYYEFYEIIVCLMSFEIGTWAHTRLNLFGVGCTTLDSVSSSTFVDDVISANSGWKAIVGSEIKYSSLMGSNMITPAVSTGKTYLIGGVAGRSWYGFMEIMEAQRLLDGIGKAGLVSKIGSIGHIFSFDAEGGVTCTEDGSVNLSTGAGMEVCKHYYVVRNVPGCAGMADGVMTAVVNSYTKMEFQDGVTWTDGTAMNGGIGILKRSIPIYRGWNLPLVGLFRQMDGAYYIVRKDSAGNNLPVQFRCASDVSRVPVRTTYTYRVPDNEECDMEIGLDLKKEYPGINLPVANDSWFKKSDYNFSLFCAETTRGGSRNYENAYLWLYINNNVSAGERCLHGSVVGCAANSGNASARTAFCNNRADSSADIYAGAFAVPYIGTNQSNAMA